MKQGKRLRIFCGLLFMMLFVVNPSTTHAAAKNYYAAVKSTATGGLSVNNKAASSSAGKSKKLTVIPIGAVCTVDPNKANGNWYWVTYKGVSGYAYGTYLYKVTRDDGTIEAAHPHRSYFRYSNGYIEYTDFTYDSYYYLEDTKATCTKQGYRTRKCGRCGYTWNVDYTSALGHNYDSGVITKAATTTSTGIKTYTCKRAGCGAKKTETIPKLKASSGNSSSGTVGDASSAVIPDSSSSGTVGDASSAIISGSSSSSTNNRIQVTSLVKGKNYTISIPEINYTYTGKALKPKVTVKYKNKKVNSKYYTVKYSENKNPGYATITVTGKGSYKSKIPATKMYFCINPKKMSKPTVSAGKGSFTVKWKTHTGVTGYEVMIARNSKFTSKAQKATLTSASFKRLDFKQMTRKATYYVKIRAYKTTSDGGILTGKWSSTKSLKTK